MKILQSMAVIATGAFLYSCNHPVQTKELAQEESREEIELRNQQWMDAVEKGDAAAVASIYTPTSQFMAPNQPVISGREGVQKFIEGVRNSGVEKIKVATSEVNVFGNSAIESGTYQIMVGGDKVVDNGKYMIEWRNEAGQWYMHRDMFNSDLPAPRSVAQKGQNVWVVVHKVKADRRQDFENFVRNTLVPAIDQNKPEMEMAIRHTRFLAPGVPDKDGSYSYMFVMDPVIDGVDYTIENLMTQKYGKEKAKVIVKELNGMMAGPFEAMMGMQTEF